MKNLLSASTRPMSGPTYQPWSTVIGTGICAGRQQPTAGSSAAVRQAGGVGLTQADAPGGREEKRTV